MSSFLDEKYILGIESSCDETSAAVVLNGRKVLTNIIYSQIDTHKRYGGVVPEIASRKHIEHIDNVVDRAICDIGLDKITAIAVTNGPGLVGALLVGVSYAKALAYSLNKPLVPINHIEGHICANYIENDNFKPPFICLVVSGGHTNIVFVEDYGSYKILGKTKDDAAGEAYDKVARALGFSYPGGPSVDLAAQKGDSSSIVFPKAFLEEDNYDFSFSGLKSAVLNHINKCKIQSVEMNYSDIAASFQLAVVDVLVNKSISACLKTNTNKLALAGGVSCNSFLRKQMEIACKKNNISLNIPSPVYCTDNAAMIGSCGYFCFVKGKRAGYDLNAYPNMTL